MDTFAEVIRLECKERGISLSDIPCINKLVEEICEFESYYSFKYKKLYSTGNNSWDVCIIKDKKEISSITETIEYLKQCLKSLPESVKKKRVITLGRTKRERDLIFILHSFTKRGLNKVNKTYYVEDYINKMINENIDTRRMLIDRVDMIMQGIFYETYVRRSSKYRGMVIDRLKYPKEKLISLIDSIETERAYIDLVVRQKIQL